MSTTKKIAFIVIVLVAVGSIWYLESLKVHPTSSGQGAQAIDVNTLLANATGTATSTNSTTINPANVAPVVQLSSGEKTSLNQLASADKAAGDQPAIHIADPTGFVNVAPGFKLSSIIGQKVILLDFWTYSCINCVRTIPYLNAWYQKYAASGLEIVGIHTPEFDFEKNITNVQNAVAEYGIQYPVVLDSNYGT